MNDYIQDAGYVAKLSADIVPSYDNLPLLSDGKSEPLNALAVSRSAPERLASPVTEMGFAKPEFKMASIKKDRIPLNQTGQPQLADSKALPKETYRNFDPISIQQSTAESDHPTYHSCPIDSLSASMNPIERAAMRLGMNVEGMPDAGEEGIRYFAMTHNAKIFPLQSKRMINQIRKQEGEHNVARIEIDNEGAIQYGLSLRGLPPRSLRNHQMSLHHAALINLQSGKESGMSIHSNYQNRTHSPQRGLFNELSKNRNMQTSGRLEGNEKITPGNQFGMPMDQDGRPLYAITKGREVIAVFALSNMPETITEVIKASKDAHYSGSGNCPWQNVLRKPNLPDSEQIQNRFLRRAVKDGMIYGSSTKCPELERVFPEREGFVNVDTLHHIATQIKLSDPDAKVNLTKRNLANFKRASKIRGTNYAKGYAQGLFDAYEEKCGRSLKKTQNNFDSDLEQERYECGLGHGRTLQKPLWARDIKTKDEANDLINCMGSMSSAAKIIGASISAVRSWKNGRLPNENRLKQVQKAAINSNII